MTISIDWTNKIVNSTASITDIVGFHSILRGFEDDVEGIIYPLTHTYKEVDLGGGAKFPAIAFINGWQLKFPAAGNYTISGGNLLATIVPVAGVFIQQTQSAAYAVTSIGSGGATPSDIATAVWGHTSAAQAIGDIEFIKGIEGGRWKIITNQMIFYATDNTTEIARFDLKDANGNATIISPMERVRV